MAAINLLLAVLVGRRAGSEDLGILALGMGGYLVLLGLNRVLLSEPMLASNRSMDLGAASAVRTLSIFAAGLALVTVETTALFLMMPVVAAAGILIFFPLIQDFHRYRLYQANSSSAALALDVVWLATVIGLSPFVQSVVSGACAWAAGAAVSVLVAEARSRIPFSGLRSSLVWWVAYGRRLALPLVVDSVFFTAGSQLLFLVLAIRAGSGEVGLIRAGLSIFGPIGLAFTAANLWALPRVAQMPSDEDARGFLRNLRAVVTVMAIAIAVAVLTARDPLVWLMYGNRIDIPVGILGALAVQTAATAAVSTSVIAAKARVRYAGIAAVRGCANVVALLVVVLSPAGSSAEWVAWVLALQAAGFLLGADLVERATRSRLTRRSGTTESIQS